MADQEHICQVSLRFISGGQTGADRAALDFAIEHGYLHSKLPPAWRAEHFDEELSNETVFLPLWPSAQDDLELRRGRAIRTPIFLLLALAGLFESTTEIISLLFEPQAAITFPES